MRCPQETFVFSYKQLSFKQNNLIFLFTPISINQDMPLSCPITYPQKRTFLEDTTKVEDYSIPTKLFHIYFIKPALYPHLKNTSNSPTSPKPNMKTNGSPPVFLPYPWDTYRAFVRQLYKECRMNVQRIPNLLGRRSSQSLGQIQTRGRHAPSCHLFTNNPACYRTIPSTISRKRAFKFN